MLRLRQCSPYLWAEWSHSHTWFCFIFLVRMPKYLRKCKWNGLTVEPWVAYGLKILAPDVDNYGFNRRKLTSTKVSFNLLYKIFSMWHFFFFFYIPVILIPISKLQILTCNDFPIVCMKITSLCYIMCCIKVLFFLEILFIFWC